jgi:hypothetical protein
MMKVMVFVKATPLDRRGGRVGEALPESDADGLGYRNPPRFRTRGFRRRTDARNQGSGSRAAAPNRPRPIAGYST